MFHNHVSNNQQHMTISWCVTWSRLICIIWRCRWTTTYMTYQHILIFYDHVSNNQQPITIYLCVHETNSCIIKDVDEQLYTKLINILILCEWCGGKKDEFSTRTLLVKSLVWIDVLKLGLIQSVGLETEAGVGLDRHEKLEVHWIGGTRKIRWIRIDFGNEPITFFC
jgi:hypothetical protein